MTRVAWQLKKEQVVKEIPGTTKKTSLYNLSRSSYEKELGTQYHKPGLHTRFVTWVMRTAPKSGPFKSLAFRAPTPEVEKMFMASFNATVASYRTLLENLNAGRLELANENFDPVEPSSARQYPGADQAYDHLLEKLAQRKFTGISPDLSGNLLDYYKDRKAPVTSAKKPVAEWTKLMGEIEQLRLTMAVSSAEAPQ